MCCAKTRSPSLIEISGTAEVVPPGGTAFGEHFEDTVVRIRPTRIIAFGIDPAQPTTPGRPVNTT